MTEPVRVTPDGLVLSFDLAAVLGSGRLRHLIEADARTSGYQLPAEVVVLLDRLEDTRRAVAAARNPPSVDELRPVEDATVKQAAARLGCSEANVRARLKRGSLPGWHDGRRWHVELGART